MNIDHASLERQLDRVSIATTFISDEHITLQEFKKQIATLEQKAIKLKATNLTITIEHQSGDESDHTEDGKLLTIHGKMLEPEEAWFRRVEDRKRANEQELKRAQSIVKAESLYLERIQECDKALEKSTLRCQDCGVPCVGWIIPAGERKAKRLCYKCGEIRSNKFYKKLGI